MPHSREDRFEELSAQVSRPLRAYVARRVPAADVDDVLSEVTVVLWRRLEEVPTGSPSGPLPWCYGVARRQIANHRRGEQRRLRLADRVRTLDPPYVSPVDEPDHDDVHAALGTLKELDREVVLLWAWEQLEAREIAQVTGLTPNAVSIRLHRAKQKLAAQLGKNAAAAGHNLHDRGSER